MIPDSSYAGVYAATVQVLCKPSNEYAHQTLQFCQKNGAFDPRTMGTSPNVGLMAQVKDPTTAASLMFCRPPKSMVLTTRPSRSSFVCAHSLGVTLDIEHKTSKRKRRKRDLQMSSDGTMRVVDATSGAALLEHKVEQGQWRPHRPSSSTRCTRHAWTLCRGYLAHVPSQGCSNQVVLTNRLNDINPGIG